MAEDKGELVSGFSAKAVKINPIPKRWARQAAKATAALGANALALESAGPSGLPGDDTLKGQGYASVPGEKFVPQRVPQPLRRQVVSTGKK